MPIRYKSVLRAQPGVADGGEKSITAYQIYSGTPEIHESVNNGTE
jgi:hypothetical protein